MLSDILGDNIGFNENLEIEFKEFTLKIDPEIYFDTREIEQIILSSKIDYDKFNTMIFDNISHYFKYYLPKYISVFGTSMLESAEMYFGINDFGELTGIPFFGTLSAEYLIELLDSLKLFINIDDDKINLDDVLSNIKIEVIELQKDIYNLDDSVQSLIDEFFAKKKQYEKEYFANLHERRKWKERMEYYVTGIRDYFAKKEYRHQVANFVREHPNYEEYNDIITLLESDDLIEISGFEEIAYRKNNKHDVIHWITEFKDITIDKLKTQRPMRMQYISFANNIYNQQLSLLTNLRYRFCVNLPDINYYVIKIKLPTNISNNIYYKVADSWIKKTRSIVCGTPGCA
jgi:hypothetical protein